MDDREFRAIVSVAVCVTETLRMAIDGVMRGLGDGEQVEAVSCMKKAKRRAKSILNSLHRTAYLCWVEQSSPSSRSNP